MKKNRLNSEFRARMRELIQGFIEHCEISQTLVGQIERFVYHRGRKYGLPTFTVYGPPQPGMETCFVNLVGINDGRDARAGETLLQLIERLVLQPHVAAGHVLKILPVSDPISLETGEALEDGDLAENGATMLHLALSVHDFAESHADGTIQIELSDSRRLGLSGSGPGSFLAALRETGEALRHIQGADALAESAEVTSAERKESPWKLYIEIPRAWSSTLAVHWVSQALVVFFRAHQRQMLRRSAEAVAWLD